MELRNRIKILEKCIVTERSDLRLRRWLLIGAAVFGLSIFAGVYFLTGETINEKNKWALSIAGTLITGFGGFSAIGVPGRRDKINWLGFLRDEYEVLCHSQGSPDPVKLEELNKLFIALYEKGIR